MSSEKKFYPESIDEYNQALTQAQTYNQSLGANSPLSAKTQTRLNNLMLLFEPAIEQRTIKKAALAELVLNKEKAKAQTAMYCSHFIQVMNLCIKRGEYNPAIRTLYQLPAEGERNYHLQSDADVQLAGRHLLAGEAERVAQGGVPMANPSAAQVQVPYHQYAQLCLQVSNAKSALFKTQSDQKPLHKEAGKVIRKIWAEVETFYNELPNESMRNHTRHWGVVYARKGHPKLITGTVTDAATGLPLAGVKIKLTNGRNTTTTTGNGQFKLSTTLMHGQTITATLKGYDTFQTTLTLIENQTTTCPIALVKGA